MLLIQFKALEDFSKNVDTVEKFSLLFSSIPSFNPFRSVLNYYF